MKPHAAFLLTTLLLVGCADTTFFTKSDEAVSLDDDSWDTANADTGGIANALRLDIYPSGTPARLEQQSVTLDPGDSWDQLDISLETSVRVRGKVVGYQATPAFAVEVPGEEVPVIASVNFTQSGSVGGGGTTTDGDGNFSMNVTPGQSYVFSVVPISPTQLPFLAVGDITLDGNLTFADEDLDLGFGEPVYGRLTDSGGKAVNDAELRLIDTATGVAGPAVSPDAEGWYELRALAGRYALEVSGEDGSYIPTIEYGVEVLADVGARLDVDLGDIDPVTVRGTLLDSAGDPVTDATVRFTSSDLDIGSASLTVETNPNRTGLFLVEVLPGRWTVELIPSLETGLSPVSSTFEVDTNSVSLQEIVAPPIMTVFSRILDPSGEPASSVVVSAQEQGFSGRSWSAVSDATGMVTLSLPAAPVSLTLSPSTADAAITHLSVDPRADDLSQLSLVRGSSVQGTIMADGEPVPYAVVEIRDPDDDALYGSAFTEEDGSFSVRVERP